MMRDPRSDAGFERLLENPSPLRRSPKPMPWGIEQEFDSIPPITIEEAYEVADVY